MKKLIPLFFIIMLFACQPQKDFEGIWLGLASEMDKEVYVPIPRIMIAKPDGSFNAYTIDNPDSNWTKWSIKNGSLHIDTSKFISSKYEISEDKFTFDGPFKTYFKRLTTPNQIDIDAFEKLITNSTWESNIDNVIFNPNNKLIINNKENKTSEKLCYTVNFAEGYTFLIKKGNHLTCDVFYRFPELITHMDKNSFTVMRWHVDSWKEITYTKNSEESTQQTQDNFQLCNPHLYRGNPSHRYYYKGNFYNGGLYKVNKLFNDFYRKPNNNKESGLIKVEFIVNCQGKPGRFSMMQFDEDYQTKSFSKEISDQIFEFTQTLTDWKAGRNKEGKNIDTFRFLTYRIKDGEVVEIFP